MGLSGGGEEQQTLGSEWQWMCRGQAGFIEAKETAQLPMESHEGDMKEA